MAWYMDSAGLMTRCNREKTFCWKTPHILVHLKVGVVIFKPFWARKKYDPSFKLNPGWLMTGCLCHWFIIFPICHGFRNCNFLLSLFLGVKKHGTNQHPLWVIRQLTKTNQRNLSKHEKSSNKKVGFNEVQGFFLFFFQRCHFRWCKTSPRLLLLQSSMAGESEWPTAGEMELGGSSFQCSWSKDAKICKVDKKKTNTSLRSAMYTWSPKDLLKVKTHNLELGCPGTEVRRKRFVNGL